jgi:hypothetical protein
MNQNVTVHIGEFSAVALAGDRGLAFERLPSRLLRALRLYLLDRDLARPGWAYPAALPERNGDQIELELAVDEDLWRRFEREARRQGVTTSTLASHAALYYASEVDAGRITQRILDQLEGEDVDDGFENG